MRVLPTALTLFLFLAGCNDAPAAPQASQDAPADATGSPMALAVVAPPTVETVPVSFDGKLGTVLHACVFPAGLCPTQAVVPEGGDLFIERPGANLTSLSLDITWTAQTPATATLAFGAMVMADCEGCNSTEFVLLEGTSPLHIQVEGVSVPLTADARVHVYAYNPQGFVHDPNVPGYAVVSVEQAYHIEGTATLLAPAA